jgi:hypothetical protein
MDAVSRTPASFDPLMAEAKQRMRRRRQLVAALLITVIGGTVMTLALRGQNGSPSPGLSSGHGLAVGALRLTAPSRLYVHYGRYPGRQVFGVAVTDYRVPAHESPGHIFYAGILPGDRVGLTVSRIPANMPNATALRLPLSLDELSQEPRATTSDGTLWNGEYRFRGRLYSVTFWVGKTAPRHDRTPLLRALASIRPAH